MDCWREVRKGILLHYCCSDPISKVWYNMWQSFFTVFRGAACSVISSWSLRGKKNILCCFLWIPNNVVEHRKKCHVIFVLLTFHDFFFLATKGVCLLEITGFPYRKTRQPFPEYLWNSRSLQIKTSHIIWCKCRNQSRIYWTVYLKMFGILTDYYV